MDADPICDYRPGQRPPVIPLTEPPGAAIHWSEAAEKRLAKVPGFVRRLVRQRAEALVAERGEQTVTPQHLAVLAARRFGARSPARPQPTGASE